MNVSPISDALSLSVHSIISLSAGPSRPVLSPMPVADGRAIRDGTKVDAVVEKLSAV